MSHELPSLATWQEWRASLPAVPDITAMPGPTRQRVRVTLTEVQRHICGLCLKPGHCCLVVDHDHDTGLVRGMLCRSCNNYEGRNSTPLLAAYCANPPAAGAGWIWDTCGSVAQIMLARAEAAGNYSGELSFHAPATCSSPNCRSGDHRPAVYRAPVPG